MKKTYINHVLSAFVFLAMTTPTFALSLWNNNVVNKVVGNCYMRADENVVLGTVTYNEICNPRVYEVTATPQYSQPTYNYQQSYSYYPSTSYTSGYGYYYPQTSYNYYGGGSNYYGNNSYYGGGYYNSYLDNPSYYQAVQTYTPSLGGSGYYNSGYGNDYGYGGGSYYGDYGYGSDYYGSEYESAKYSGYY